MQYTIEKIDNGIATVRYADGSWAQIVMSSDMTQADLDAKAWDFRPKVGSAPSFVSVGLQRDASPIPQDLGPLWLQNRVREYGSLNSQIEYIVENGLEAWQSEVAKIKAKYPKE